MLETRSFELRQTSGQSRQLTGIAIRYGSPTKIGRINELFEARAFGDLSQIDILLYRQHNRDYSLARTDGGGMTLSDDERRLLVSADMPETRDADDVLELVNKNIMRGLSIGFDAIEERFENNTRIISKARLDHIAVVDKPAYVDAIVQAGEVRSLESRYGFVRRKRIWR